MLFDENSESFPVILSKKSLQDISFFKEINRNNVHYLDNKEYCFAYCINKCVLSDINHFIEDLIKLASANEFIYLNVYEEEDEYTSQFNECREEVKICNILDAHIIKYELEYHTYHFDKYYLFEVK